MLKTLELNVTYVVTVMSLVQAADSFNSAAGKKYCHHIEVKMADDATVLKGQICSESAEMTWFKPGDKIDMVVTNYKGSATSAPYTFKFQGLHASAGAMATKAVSEALAGNPIVAGTVNDRALVNAIAFHSANSKVKLDLNAVINTAYLFQDYYNNQLRNAT